MKLVLRLDLLRHFESPIHYLSSTWCYLSAITEHILDSMRDRVSDLSSLTRDLIKSHNE